MEDKTKLVCTDDTNNFIEYNGFETGREAILALKEVFKQSKEYKMLLAFFLRKLSEWIDFVERKLK